MSVYPKSSVSSVSAQRVLAAWCHRCQSCTKVAMFDVPDVCSYSPAVFGHVRQSPLPLRVSMRACVRVSPCGGRLPDTQTDRESACKVMKDGLEVPPPLTLKSPWERNTLLSLQNPSKAIVL
ncbi:unnamed protein product [Leuciscus chuanchicus]